jgi:anti-sigma factor RsiW
MNCDRAVSLIGAYTDGELDVRSRHTLESHLRTCAGCATQHADLLALRKRLRSEVPYFAAPPGFRERLQAQLASADAEERARHAARRREPGRPFAPLLDALGGVVGTSRWRSLTVGALGGCAATVFALVVGTAVVDWRADNDLVAQAVSSHVRATLDQRLVDVVSSDRHTVKPWLSARLDYSPPVRDLAADGFPLLGGRLTTLQGRPTATLVYGYRKHTIDVYVRPEAREVPPHRDVRGFNVVHARGAGWDWLAVSDASPDVLDAFLAELLRQAAQP